ncbi:MAG: LPS-assembly protein LptD [Gammaproteobacteria bacterium]
MNGQKLAIAALLALTSAPSQADDDRWALCPALPERALPVGPDAGLPVSDAPLHIQADSVDSERTTESLFSGRVLLQQGSRTLTADRVRHERADNLISGEGEIRFVDDSVELAGQRALLDLNTDRVRFDDLEFRLFARRARGSADSLEAGRDIPITVTDARYTTCPADSEAWSLHAPRLELDTETGVGVGRNVRVEFMGVPIFYTPWISFPLNDERKSGFLVPDAGRARNTGIDIRAPWYWNIAPERDATITPRWMGERGLQVGTEYRYLYQRHQGQLDLEVLPTDRQRGDTRARGAWWHISEAAAGWQFHADVQHVSDELYYEDLAGGMERTIVTHLPKRMELSYHGDQQSWVARLDGWQTLDDTIPTAAHPYSRLPQVLWHARWPASDRGAQLSVDAEAVYFHTDDDTRVTGSRMDIVPSATWVLDGAGWHVVPRAAWRHTHYALSGGLPEQSRTLPLYSVDTGLTFDRPMSGDRVQTLEPRVYWLRIPYREQSALPLFDTSAPDFNMVQLYSDNRFNGADRVGDTHQAAVGASSRVFSARTGAQLMSLQLGRIRYFDERRVTLPGGTPASSRWSDYLGEASINLSSEWSTRVALQYDPDSAHLERSLVQLRWHPDRDRLLNLGWRFRRGQIDQTDIAFAWPLGSRWSAVGRWNWSVDERRNIETFVGFEYQSCCWAIRVVSREYIATRAGDTSHSLYFQLELKGLANVGRGTGAMLERGILGYSARR